MDKKTHAVPSRAVVLFERLMVGEVFGIPVVFIVIVTAAIVVGAAVAITGRP